MDLRLRGKVAMVSGASKGIGRAVAFGLAEEGVHLTLNARGSELLEKMAEEIRRQCDVQVLVVPGDMSQLPDVQTFVQRTRSPTGVGSTSWSMPPGAPRGCLLGGP